MTVLRLAMPPDPGMPLDVQDDLTAWCYGIGADPGSLTAITVTEEPPEAPFTTIYWIGHPEGERLAPMAPLPPDNAMPFFQPVPDA